MKIRHFMMLGSLILLILLVLGGTVFYIAAKNHDTATKEFIFAQETLKGTFELTLLTDEFLLHPGHRIHSQWHTKYKSLGALLRNPGFSNSDKNIFVATLRKYHGKILHLFTEMVSSLKRTPYSSAERQIITDQQKGLSSQLITTSQAMASWASRLASLSQDEMMNSDLRFQWMNIALFLSLLVLIAASSVILQRRVVSPLNYLASKIPQFRDRKLDYSLEVSRTDEIGEVTAALNQMAADLKKILVSRDELRVSEEKIKNNLAEKEIMLKEIHHRVKNNLQVISSMLSLQAQTQGDNDPAKALHESQRRIKVMARIHENIHKSNNLASINARDYLNDIAHDTKASSGGNDDQQISLDLDVDDCDIDVDDAMVYGPIISELISNSLGHAFPNNRPGNINISLHLSGGMTELIIADNGIGLPEDFDLENSKTLGMRLVNALAMQLGGEVNVESTGGTRVRIIFPGERS